MGVVDAIRESGAIESSLYEARLFVERGLAALDKMPNTDERQALESLALFVVNRQI